MNITGIKIKIKKYWLLFLGYFKKKSDHIELLNIQNEVNLDIHNLPPLFLKHSNVLNQEKIILFVNFLKRMGGNGEVADPLNNYVLSNDHPGLPDWWGENGNILFMPKELDKKSIPIINLHPGMPPTKNCLVALNGKTNYSLILWGDGGILYVAENAELPNSNIAFGGGVVFIGENVRSTCKLEINCRNKGLILLESDILLAADVNLMTDDCHTIFSTKINRRINPYGGVICIGNHVWIGTEALIMGNSFIGNNTIVGAKSFVRNVNVIGGCILAGVPAKVIKNEVSWDSTDFPPEHIFY